MSRKSKQNGPKGKKLKLALVILAAYAVTVIAIVVTIDARHVRFYLTDEQEMNIEYGEEFSDPGAYAVTAGRMLGESEKHLNVSASGSVNSAELGDYEIEYTARYMFRDYSTVRKVHVVDTTAPVIKLEYKENYTPSWVSGYEEEGFTAFDTHDGDLTGNVVRTEKDDSVIYTVTDASGNTATAERKVNYILTTPDIILNGEEHMQIKACLDFKDPGCKAVDGMGNDLSEYLKCEGEVCPYRAGTYELVYTLSNEQGESVSKTRTVEVLPIKNPDTVTPSEKTIYLTFDDGPGPYTGQLLDVLAEYNAKATFFVTGTGSDYNNMIGRAASEGHSIGVHTYCHNYYTIYAGEKAFFDDFNAVEELIYEQTGSYTRLCRFPGGSSNTVSSFNPGIMSRLASALTDLGYVYFDWNVSSGDAGETNITSEVADNIINGCSQKKISVVLQHDIKDYSVKAVERVLIWGINNGYTFRALDTASPTAHHGIAN